MSCDWLGYILWVIKEWALLVYWQSWMNTFRMILSITGWTKCARVFNFKLVHGVRIKQRVATMIAETQKLSKEFNLRSDKDKQIKGNRFCLATLMRDYESTAFLVMFCELRKVVDLLVYRRIFVGFTLKRHSKLVQVNYCGRVFPKWVKSSLSILVGKHWIWIEWVKP